MNSSLPVRRLVASMLLVYSGLILWLGSLVFFGFGVASVVFKQLPSKDLAGSLNAVILYRLNIVECVAAVLLLVGIVIYNFGSPHRRNVQTLVPVGLVVVMIILMLVYAQGISPAMNTLRSQIHSFDAPITSDSDALVEFRSFHVLYSRLVGANMLLGIIVFVWQTILFASTIVHNSSQPSTSETASI